MINSNTVSKWAIYIISYVIAMIVGSTIGGMLLSSEDDYGVAGGIAIFIALILLTIKFGIYCINSVIKNTKEIGE